MSEPEDKPDITKSPRWAEVMRKFEEIGRNVAACNEIARATGVSVWCERCCCAVIWCRCRES